MRTTIKKLILISTLLLCSNGISSTPPDINSFRNSLEKFESEQYIKFDADPVNQPDADMNELSIEEDPGTPDP